MKTMPELCPSTQSDREDGNRGVLRRGKKMSTANINHPLELWAIAPPEETGLVELGASTASSVLDL